MGEPANSYVQNCLSKFRKNAKQNLTVGRKLNADTFVTCIKDMTLDEYSVAVKRYCNDCHRVRSCSKCKPVLEAINEIGEKGIVPLSTVYRKCFGSVYKSDKAVRRIIQLPVIIFRCFDQLFVTEYVDGLDFTKLASCVAKYVPQNCLSSGIDKENLKLLCELASSEKDRRLIRVASCQGKSGNEAKRLGVSNLNKEKKIIYDAMQEYLEIKQAVNKIAQAKIVNMEPGNDSDTTTCDSSEGQSCVWITDDKSEEQNMSDGQTKKTDVIPPILPSQADLISMLTEHKMNWLSFVEHLKLNVNHLSEQTLEQLLENFSDFIPFSNLTVREKKDAEQSYEAYLAMKEVPFVENTEALTESESDNPEDWVELKGTTIHSATMQAKIHKQTAILKKYKKRIIAKEVAHRCLLRRKVPNRVSRTLLKYPDIGKDIEKFARENRIGADSWRRTGILTFSGNVKRGPKVTYKRIKEHLEEKYGVRFGYGTIVQLCCVRNRRRLSAKRYFGVAKIVSRRARKGFAIKLNVDAHWSCSFYKTLDFLQLKDGRDKVVLNRDDASGFRLDSTFTHKQHKVLSEAGNPELTTRTDFLNKYTATLQTTSYMFLETETTPETCVGVAKAHTVHKKNPGQHAGDLEMVANHDEAKYAFSGEIDCIRVDGATDEGPSHFQVQFMWTERHLRHGKICTLVTSRFAGGSYLNKVELQNGCLALGHSNLFIPSTIYGSNFVNGELDRKLLVQNLEVALSTCVHKYS